MKKPVAGTNTQRHPRISELTLTLFSYVFTCLGCSDEYFKRWVGFGFKINDLLLKSDFRPISIGPSWSN